MAKRDYMVLLLTPEDLRGRPPWGRRKKVTIRNIGCRDFRSPITPHYRADFIIYQMKDRYKVLKNRLGPCWTNKGIFPLKNMVSPSRIVRLKDFKILKGINPKTLEPEYREIFPR